MAFMLQNDMLCFDSRPYDASLRSAGLLQFRTLWCKLIAVTFSMGGGLIAGKDGPLIHTGGIVGGGLGKLSPRCFPAPMFDIPRTSTLTVSYELLACTQQVPSRAGHYKTCP